MWTHLKLGNRPHIGILGGGSPVAINCIDWPGTTALRRPRYVRGSIVTEEKARYGAMAKISSDDSDSDDGRLQDDDFDVDNMDFDLPSAPVPSRPAASTSRAGSASSSAQLSAQQQAMLNSFSGSSTGGAYAGRVGGQNSSRIVGAEDSNKYKHYQAIYPIYIDASRARKTGERRVSKSKALRFPKAQEIAEVCGRFLGLSPVFEPEKVHPRDWANPGRVRVLLKDEAGRLLNPKISDSEPLHFKLMTTSSA